jgi:hypothetical protein
MQLWRTGSKSTGLPATDRFYRSAAKLVVRRFKVQIVNRTGEVFGRREFPLHERLVDDDLGSYIREFEPLPRFHLHLHWFEVALHAINADRNAIDQ